MLVSIDYPYLQIEVTIRRFRSRFRALLDTGFDGHLVLPEALGAQLGTPDFLVTTRLADGTAKRFSTYQGGVEIVNLGAQVAYIGGVMLLGTECLMGQGIIKLLKVTFDHGSQVVVEP